MHRWLKEPDGTIVLYIGAKNWPTPIPLVNKGSSWYFDTDAARKRFCLDELAGMNIDHSCLPGTRGAKRNNHPQSTPSNARKSS